MCILSFSCCKSELMSLFSQSEYILLACLLSECFVSRPSALLPTTLQRFTNGLSVYNYNGCREKRETDQVSERVMNKLFYVIS